MGTVRIYDTESSRDIALKIYNQMEVCASCTISGFLNKDGALIPKGQEVLDFIQMFYELDHVKFRGDKMERKYKFRDNSIGGPIAHKIFTWEKRIVDSEVRFTIWRFQ